MWEKIVLEHIKFNTRLRRWDMVAVLFQVLGEAMEAENSSLQASSVLDGHSAR